ncbi:MAG: acyloxyacyl hydrolase [Pseudomonadota bacterium]
MIKKSMCSISAGCVACLTALSGYALDGASFQLGNGDGTDMVRAGLQWDWRKTWFDTSPWRLGGYWDISLGAWHAHNGAGDTGDIVDLGVTPVFRLRQNVKTGFAPYFEFAIGFHVLSHTRLDAQRQFGSSFQFGDHLGVGACFGPKQQYDLAYLYQHLSNGGIKEPNDGINFSQLRFAYHFY